MGVPVIYTDFDGVLNAFPDDKVLRRGGVGHTGWMKADDARRELYSDERAFRLDGNEQARTPVGRFRIHWSTELAGAMHALAVSGRVELNWLSTWQPYCVNTLDPMLGWDPSVVHNTVWVRPGHHGTASDGQIVDGPVARARGTGVGRSVADRVDRRRGML